MGALVMALLVLAVVAVVCTRTESVAVERLRVIRLRYRLLRQTRAVLEALREAAEPIDSPVSSTRQETGDR